MTGSAAPLALAGLLLVLSSVLAITLIPVLEGELRRLVARRIAALAANDNAAGAEPRNERRAG